MPRAIQRFEVSLKAFILKDGRALLVRESDTGFWELPGGRIDVGEEWGDHRRILLRELGEELGSQFQVCIGDAAVTWVRAHSAENRFVFLVARVCRWTVGEPALSGEHDEYVWVTSEEWKHLGFPADSGYLSALDELWRLSGSVR